MCPKVTEEYRQEMRDGILRAAQKVFARKGYHAASMDDIVKESGLSKGALYGYFESKEELFLALRERQQEPHYDEMISAMHAGASSTEKLTKVGQLAFRQEFDADRNTLLVLFEFLTASQRIKGLHRRNIDRYYRFHTPLAGLIREGIERGEFRRDLDPDALASILMAGVDGLCLHRSALGLDFDTETVERTFLAMALSGILASPPKPGRK